MNWKLQTRRECQEEAEKCLTCASDVVAMAEDGRRTPDWREVQYWTGLAQVYATLALTAKED